MIATMPKGPVEVPARVVELAGGRPLRAVWCNEVGGLTFEMTRGGRKLFIKWQPPMPAVDLGAEADRLEWASRFTVPEPTYGIYEVRHVSERTLPPPLP